MQQTQTTDRPVKEVDEKLDNRYWLIQSVCDRVCDAYGNKDEFIQELEELINKHNLNYRIEYKPSEFKKIKIGCE